MREQISAAEEWRALLADLRALARKHAALAREEGREAVGDVIRGSAWIVAGAVAGLSAVLFLPVLLTILLAVWMPTWAAAVVAMAGALTVAGVLLIAGVRRIRRPKMQRTRGVLREDAAWIRDLIVSLRRSGQSGDG
jgi:hypothetical protein